jgi:hypothetical protein
MIIPKLKRIKVSSEHELRNWLAKNSEQKQEVMIVTCNKKSRDKHISCDLVRDALDENGWAAGQSYTLDGNLVGHVVSYTRLSETTLSHPILSILRTLVSPAAHDAVRLNRCESVKGALGWWQFEQRRYDIRPCPDKRCCCPQALQEEAIHH